MAPISVLTVDDNPAQGYVMCRLLESCGFRHEAVPTASAAWQRIKQQTPLPDLVLVDLHLPDLGGLELCRLVRQNAPTRDVPIILYTSQHSSAWAIDGAYQVGASFLFLPVSADELEVLIKAKIGGGADQSCWRDS
jgi:CheY-like chemotaxis protein